MSLGSHHYRVPQDTNMSYLHLSHGGPSLVIEREGCGVHRFPVVAVMSDHTPPGLEQQQFVTI